MIWWPITVGAPCQRCTVVQLYALQQVSLFGPPPFVFCPVDLTAVMRNTVQAVSTSDPATTALFYWTVRVRVIALPDRYYNMHGSRKILSFVHTRR